MGYKFGGVKGARRLSALANAGAEAKMSSKRVPRIGLNNRVVIQLFEFLANIGQNPPERRALDFVRSCKISAQISGTSILIDRKSEPERGSFRLLTAKSNISTHGGYQLFAN
jgi:hypothetical protein